MSTAEGTRIQERGVGADIVGTCKNPMGEDGESGPMH